MAHAPNNILQLVAANNKKPVVPHPFSDYESYFYTLLRFIHKQLPWDTVVSQNLSDSEKAKQILKQRSVKLVMRAFLKIIFLSIEMSSAIVFIRVYSIDIKTSWER